MICEMAGLAVFLVLCCISAGAQEHRDKPGFSKDTIGPLIWGPVYKLGADKTYLSLGQGSDQPIEIDYKKGDHRNTASVRKETFEGNVTVKQGDVTLRCDRLVIVYYEKKGANTGKGRAKRLAKDLDYLGNIKSITASGNVKIIQNERMAVADEALYDNVQSTIILKGGPALLRDGSELLNGAQIIINRHENRIDSR